MALLHGGGAVASGALSIRGVLTTFVYLPPAIVTSMLGPASTFWTVLAWNSLLAAVVCVILLPRIAALVAPAHSIARIWVSAGIGGVLLSGFARYPLLDTWAVAIALAGLYWLASGWRRTTWIVAGIAFAIALNLRPAYVVPLAISVAILLIVRYRRSGWVLVGTIAGLVPQLAFNLAKFGSLSVVPPDTAGLVSVQAAYAAWAIRYDTVLYAARPPQQWYCDPSYAAQVAGDKTPTDQLGVVQSLAEHFPQSIWFLVQKAAASLRWSFSTPYEHGPDPVVSPMWLLVVGVVAVGVVALVVRALLSRQNYVQFAHGLSILGFWTGSLATLVLSTPETRFAMPLVMVGVIGVLSAVPLRFSSHLTTRRSVIGVATIFLIAAGLFSAGTIATAHPAPPGHWTSASDCARF